MYCNTVVLLHRKYFCTSAGTWTHDQRAFIEQYEPEEKARCDEPTLPGDIVGTVGRLR